MQLRAFVRREIVPGAISELTGLLRAAPMLLGRTGLVVGASRGLGAQLVQALALQGVTVIGAYHRDREAAGALAESVVGAPGRIVMVQS